MKSEKLKVVDVSIIIVNWNTRQITCECLKSVYEQTKELSFEVIVVENGSSDSSVEMVKNEYPRVILIENQENRGFAAANNQGMAIAKGKYVLLLNSDTFILDDAIRKAVSLADDHPKAAVVGCRILNADMTMQQSCFMFPSLLNMVLSSSYLYKLFPRSKFFGRERMSWWDRRDEREVDVVTGCFMLIRREAIEAIGMMDEQFFMYAEETDWCYRFKQAGWRILFTPEVEIVHLGGQSSQQVRNEMLIQVAVSILQFMRKHYNWLTYQLASLLIIIFFMARLPVWLSVALLSSKKRLEAFDRVKTYTVGIGKVLSH